MNVPEIISRIRSKGVTLRTFGDRLQAYSKQAIPHDLLEELGHHNQEIFNYLYEETTVAGALPGPIKPLQSPSLGADILSLPLRQFAKTTHVIDVASDTLKDDIVLAGDDAVIDPGEQRVVYRAHELCELAGCSPEELCQIHTIKRQYGGCARAN